MRTLLLPPLANKTSINTMAKTTALPAATSANSVDTIITLPLSNKTIAVKKGLSADKIKILDKYFFKHQNIVSNSQSIIPDIQDCSTYYQYVWEWENQFSPVSGRYLGIWPSDNIVTLGKAYNTYGFSLACVDYSRINMAHDSGFAYSNIMVNVGSYYAMPDYFNQYPKCGYYLIDEPYENNYDQGLVQIFNNWANPSIVMLDDYDWPSTDGSEMAGYEANNTRIMCDQYVGTIYGDPLDYWNKYTENYGTAFFIAGWLNNTQDLENWWGSSFSLVNNSLTNISQIWLYALNTGNESLVESFCETAWQNGWLLRLEKETEIIWKCTNSQPCTNCNWNNNQGNWYIYDSFYTGQQQYSTPY